MDVLGVSRVGVYLLYDVKEEEEEEEGVLATNESRSGNAVMDASQ